MSDTTMSEMTGAELKVMLGGLGLPPGWFAERMGVTMRTVVRWFDGDLVSVEVADEVQHLSTLTINEMKHILDTEQTDDAGDVVLKTYRVDKEFVSKLGWPAEWHRALIFRVAEHLRAQDFSVRIEYR